MIKLTEEIVHKTFVDKDSFYENVFLHALNSVKILPN